MLDMLMKILSQLPLDHVSDMEENRVLEEHEWPPALIQNFTTISNTSM